MTYADKVKRALEARLGAEWLVFMPGWSVPRRNGLRRVAWRGASAVPDGLLLHHTAAAATDSTSPAAKGNQTGANMGVVNYIQSHFKVPAANFTLDRDGTVYVHNVYPVWHAGVGSFAGKAPWSGLGIPKDMGNDYLLGVEIMSKGLKKDFTAAQKETLAYLLWACADASGWVAPKGQKSLIRRPQHKDWTDRKVDLKYTNDEVAAWL